MSSLGVSSLLNCCRSTLLDLEASCLDQESFKSDVFLKLGLCFGLESLDLSGCRGLDDTAFTNMSKCEQLVDGKMVATGLPCLKVVKINYTGCTDFGLVTLCKLAPNIEHLELNRLETLTEYSLKFVFKELPQLKLLDTNGVPAMTY